MEAWYGTMNSEVVVASRHSSPWSRRIMTVDRAHLDFERSHFRSLREKGKKEKKNSTGFVL